MAPPAETDMSSAVALLNAVEAAEMRVHYQGIFPLQQRDRLNFEALVRWEHPSRGMLPPREFLPPDMGSGIGWTLTSYVLDVALRQCAAWRAAGHDVGVSVNIAPGPNAGDLLADEVEHLLDRFDIAPELLTLEITEQRCAMDLDGIATALRRLAEVGVRLSLDDFGTGESTYMRLRDIGFDEVKIDRCFVAELTNGSVDHAIVRSVTNLAHELGASVVAEGIEDREPLEILHELGVDAGQGFLLQRPLAEPLRTTHTDRSVTRLAR